MMKTNASNVPLPWEQRGKVIPFPSIRRVGFIQRKAWAILIRPAQLRSNDHARTRDKLVRSLMHKERERLHRYGIDDVTIEREATIFEAAIRVAMATMLEE